MTRDDTQAGYYPGDDRDEPFANRPDLQAADPERPVGY